MSILPDDAHANDTLRKAVDLAADLGPENAYSIAAIKMAAEATRLPMRVKVGTDTDNATLNDLIDQIREIIRQDPDQAGRWVDALGVLLSFRRSVWRAQQREAKK